MSSKQGGCEGVPLAPLPSAPSPCFGSLWESRLEALVGQVLIARALGPSSGTSTEFSCPVSLSSSSPTMEKPEKGLGPCPADRILLPEAQLLSAWGLHFCHQGMGTARQSPEAPTGSFSNSQQYHNNNKDNVNNNDDNSKSIIAIIHCEVPALVPSSLHVLSLLVLKTTPPSGCYHHLQETGCSE